MFLSILVVFLANCPHLSLQNSNPEELKSFELLRVVCNEFDIENPIVIQNRGGSRQVFAGTRRDEKLRQNCD